MSLIRASIAVSVMFVARNALAAPGPPSNVAAHYKRASVTITWKAPKEPVASYHIYKASNLIGTVPGGGPLSFKDSAPRSGRTYTYLVTAVDEFGNESKPATVRLSIP